MPIYKPEIYHTCRTGDVVSVYRRDRHHTLWATVDKWGLTKFAGKKERMPKYIKARCQNILDASPFEVARGYNYAGLNCRADGLLPPEHRY